MAFTKVFKRGELTINIYRINGTMNIKVNNSEHLNSGILQEIKDLIYYFHEFDGYEDIELHIQLFLDDKLYNLVHYSGDTEDDKSYLKEIFENLAVIDEMQNYRRIELKIDYSGGIIDSIFASSGIYGRLEKYTDEDYTMTALDNMGNYTVVIRIGDEVYDNLPKLNEISLEEEWIDYQGYHHLFTIDGLMGDKEREVRRLIEALKIRLNIRKKTYLYDVIDYSHTYGSATLEITTGSNSNFWSKEAVLCLFYYIKEIVICLRDYKLNGIYDPITFIWNNNQLMFEMKDGKPLITYNDEILELEPTQEDNSVLLEVDKDFPLLMNSLIEEKAKKGKTKSIKEFKSKNFVLNDCTQDFLIRNIITERDGILKKTVSGQTDYLIYSNNTNKSFQKALELHTKGKGIKWISEKDFIKFINKEIEEKISKGRVYDICMYKDKSFVMTGCKNESLIEKTVTDRGGKIKSSVSGVTDYLVYNSIETVKFKTALKMFDKGKPVRWMHEQDFLDIISNDEK